MSEATELQRTIITPDSYFDPDIYRLEMDRIFGHAWLHVCHATKLPGPGDYVTCNIGDQRIIVMRGEAGVLRAFYNVCQHRGRELLEGSGNTAAIICPYHGWTYHTDGSLKYARGSDLVPGLDTRKICLQQVRVDTLAGFVFVNLDMAAAPLASVYEGFDEELRGFEPNIEDLVHVHSTTFDLAVNWKIAVENYLEGYHLASVHPALHNSVHNDQWTKTLHPHYTSDIGRANPDGDDIAYDFTAAEKLEQTNWWLWPMVMFEQMPGSSHIFTYNHLPLGPERTLQVVDFYFPNDSLTDEQQAMIEYVEKVVRLEDKAAIEGVQRGLHSRGYRHGPLMMGPDVPAALTEKGVLHFQKLVAGALS
ncbi:MAG: aromatic ring-hydroxylating dioxygenase subunit alpha [Rhodospirillales bacterium]|jgi:choline monooxygenase